MLARIVSDLHLDACPMQRPQKRADIALVAGDCMNGKPTQVIDAICDLLPEHKILFVPGNHEAYGASSWDEMIRQLQAQCLTSKRVELLYRKTIVIDGIRFIGCTLWSDFKIFGTDKQQACMQHAQSRMQDFRLIRNAGARLTPAQMVRWFESDVQFLNRELQNTFSGPTVVMTHHGPNRLSIAPIYRNDPLTAAFVSQLPDSMFNKADWWIHGHTHYSFDYIYQGCRIICNPRGYSNSPVLSTENRAFSLDQLFDLTPRPHIER